MLQHIIPNDTDRHLVNIDWVVLHLDFWQVPDVNLLLTTTWEASEGTDLFGRPHTVRKPYFDPHSCGMHLCTWICCKCNKAPNKFSRESASAAEDQLIICILIFCFFVLSGWLSRLENTQNAPKSEIEPRIFNLGSAAAEARANRGKEQQWCKQGGGGRQMKGKRAGEEGTWRERQGNKGKEGTKEGHKRLGEHCSTWSWR